MAALMYNYVYGFIKATGVCAGMGLDVLLFFVLYHSTKGLLYCALRTNTVASQWLCNSASSDTGKYRNTGKEFVFFLLISYTITYCHMCVTSLFTTVANVVTFIVIYLSKL